MADVSLNEAPVILEGHGRPNVFLAGEVGQKYKDLDSGLEWNGYAKEKEVSSKLTATIRARCTTGN